MAGVEGHPVNLPEQYYESTDTFTQQLEKHQQWLRGDFITGAQLVVPENSIFRNVRFHPKYPLAGAVIHSCVFFACDFSSQVLTDADLSGSQFYSCSFAGSALTNVLAQDCVFHACNHMGWNIDGAIFEGMTVASGYKLVTATDVEFIVDGTPADP